MGEFGRYVRESRQFSEGTLKHLSEETGYSRAYLSELERGVKPPTGNVVKRLSGVLYLNRNKLVEFAAIDNGYVTLALGDNARQRELAILLGRLWPMLGENPTKRVMDILKIRARLAERD